MSRADPHEGAACDSGRGGVSAAGSILFGNGNQVKLFRKIGSAGAYPKLLLTVDNKATGDLVEDARQVVQGVEVVGNVAVADFVVMGSQISCRSGHLPLFNGTNDLVFFEDGQHFDEAVSLLTREQQAVAHG